MMIFRSNRTLVAVTAIRQPLFIASIKSIGVLAVASLLSSPLTVAQENEITQEHWGEWRALGSGYVARRREPPKLNHDAMERQLDGVQQNSSKLQLKKARLISEQSENKTVSMQQSLKTMDRRIASSSKTQSDSVAALNAETEAPAVVNALWLRTLEEGLYSVAISDLAAQLGKPEKNMRRRAENGTLSLTNNKQPASWHYDAESDSLLFVGENYDTFYSDQNAYRFRWGKSQAQPMAVTSGEANNIAGSDIPFPETLKFEEEPDLFYSPSTVADEPDADYWFWDYLYGGYRDVIEIALAIPNPALEGTAQLRVTMRGWTDLESGDEHYVYAELNGVQVGSAIIWDAFDEAVLVADFDQSLLNSDGNNVIALRNSYATGTHPGQNLDQIEVDYLRQPVAVAGKLWMHDVQAGQQSVSGFASADILLVEAPGAKAVLRQDFSVQNDGAGGWVVSFESIEGGDYLVVERSNTIAPLVASDYKSGLASRQNRADYLIIAPRDFSATANALASYRSSSFGHTKVVWLDDIYDEFSAGRTDPSALARFMKTVMRKWAVPPSYVVLLGKGTLDEKDRMGYGDSFLPVLLTTNPWSLAVSDTRLLGYELEAPFALGRIPITSDEEGLGFLEKVTQYESGASAPHYSEAVLVADNPDDAGGFHHSADKLADRLFDSLGFTEVSKLYHPQDTVRASLIASQTWNTAFVSYGGHGSTSQAGNGSESFIKASDAELLVNTQLPIFAALTCAVGDDSMPGTRSLAAALVLNSTGGAIGSVAPTGLSLDADGQILISNLVDGLYYDERTIGEALLKARTQSRGLIADFMPAMYSVIGDPAIRAR